MQPLPCPIPAPKRCSARLSILSEWDPENKSFSSPQTVTPNCPSIELAHPKPLLSICLCKSRGSLGVLTQIQGPTPQPVGYLSKELDNLAKGWSSPLVLVAQKLIFGWPLTIYTPHDLGGLLKEEYSYQATVYLSIRPNY
jgi:hypothetical protein